MPVEADVDILEQSVAHHERLGPAPFLGRAAVEANRPFDVALRNLLLDGDARRRRRDTEEMMPAGMAVAVPVNSFAEWIGGLRQFGERIVLAENGDDRLALAESSRERGGNLRHAAFDLEARFLESIGQQCRRFLLLVAGLGPFPDLARHRPGSIGAR